ncbi:hypothetical protein ACN38_g9947 [Penicillium nordicum]|uniref:Integrase catalytic domain-containing protein n=1 Tax=Penicillium nordicum TaxID=229535 RepID=A0A0M8NTR0_9EURO|nr:hypothetical protein ACN38_g9947 [Penicillium nordicum]
MKLNDLTVTLKDVRHILERIPTLCQRRFCMIRDLFHKRSTPPFHYVLEDPSNQRFFAVRNSSDVYTFTADEPFEVSSQAFVIIATPANSRLTSDEPIPIAGEQQLVAYFSSNAKSNIKAKPSSGDEHVSKASIDIKSAFPTTLWEWHVTLAHLNYRDVLYLANRPGSGVKITGDKAQPPCQVCLQANITRRYSRRQASRATRPLMRIHVDIVGGGDVFSDDDDASQAANLQSRHGYKYFLLITDDATRFRWIYSLISRDRREIAARLRYWRQHINNLGFKTPAFLRSDNEFGSGELQSMMTEWGCQWEPSNPYSAWQNGRVVGYNGASIYTVWDPETGRLFNTGDIRPTGAARQTPFQGGEQVTKQTPDSTSSEELTDPITDDNWVRPAKEVKVFAAMTKTSQSAADVPRSFKEAMESVDRVLWDAACRKEVDDLHKRNTWELNRTGDVPIGLRPIPGKWGFAKKQAVDGTTRYKARWVIRGNISNGHQSLWGETAAPFVMASTKLVLFAAAAHYGWHIAQADAITAFLNGKLPNSVYMRQPYGFEQGERGTLVCKLKQALYGLIPAARIWYDTLREKLEAIGFRISPYDAGLFLHKTKPNLYVTAHVDDFGIIGANRTEIQWILSEMGKQFPIKDLGQMEHYLGLRVEQTEAGIKLSQPDFIDKLLDDAGMPDCYPVATPIEPGLVIDDLHDLSIDKRQYQSVTGSLQWLASHTRPEIARVPTLLAHFNTVPTQKTLSTQRRVLRYLKGSKQLGIVFRPGSGMLPPPVLYTDADRGGPLTPGRRSCSGYVMLLAGGPVSWRSHLQASVALSSNKAEYMAVSDAAREVEWLTRLVADMGLYAADAEPITFYMDNKGAHDLVRTSFVSRRSKHVDIRYHYVRDIAARGIINPTPIGTRDMAADGFTKPLAEESFKRFGGQIGVF